MSRELDAYRRAFHCGAGGHDGHPEDGALVSPNDQVWADRCSLAVAWSTLRKALREIEYIEDKSNGGEWDEITEARAIATKALGDSE